MSLPLNTINSSWKNSYKYKLNSSPSESQEGELKNPGVV